MASRLLGIEGGPALRGDRQPLKRIHVHKAGALMNWFLGPGHDGRRRLPGMCVQCGLPDQQSDQPGRQALTRTWKKIW